MNEFNKSIGGEGASAVGAQSTQTAEINTESQSKIILLILAAIIGTALLISIAFYLFNNSASTNYQEFLNTIETKNSNSNAGVEAHTPASVVN